MVRGYPGDAETVDELDIVEFIPFDIQEARHHRAYQLELIRESDMPELPEIETNRRALSNRVSGRRIPNVMFSETTILNEAFRISFI
jgi:hypothetical protein